MRHLSQALITGLLIFCLGTLALPCLAGPRSSPAGAEPALVDQFWSVQRLRGASAPPSSGVDRIGQDQDLSRADRDLEILASPEPPGSTAPFCPEGPQGISFRPRPLSSPWPSPRAGPARSLPMIWPRTPATSPIPSGSWGGSSSTSEARPAVAAGP